ncbi:MAG: hypothetical protein NZ872_03450 [Archaeoglobaceae archaeon]|nr:hypothetical protein [Archaeoglobaceae archaeon]MDW8128254.1 hypothetical protein [Archaeoglobaceae archaeon]
MLRIVRNALLTLIPVIVCTSIYFAGDLKNSLILIYPSEISRLILTSYTSNFVHYTFEHFISNMVLFLSCSFASIYLLEKMNLQIFGKMLLAIMVLVPFLCSGATILWLEFYPSQNQIVCGFSGISSATVGIFLFCLSMFSAFEKQDFNKSDVSYTYFMALFSIIYYFLVTYIGAWGYLSVILPLIPFSLLSWKHRRQIRKLLTIFSAFLIVAVSVGIISTFLFPKVVIQNGQINVLAHYVGLIFGVFISYWISLSVILKVENASG